MTAATPHTTPAQPLVSVIVANYNKAPFIAETIRSVCWQSYTNWELLIVDDGSTDGSAQIISELAADEPRLKPMLNSQNRGGNYCRNQALQLARGEYVLLLDSDDLLDEHCLQNRLQVAEQQPQFDVWIFGMAAFYHQPGDAPPALNWQPAEGPHLQLFLRHQLPWSICMPLWRTGRLLGLNGFDDTFHRLQDVELHTRALLSGLRVHINSGPPDCHYRILPERNQSNHTRQLQTQVAAAVQYYRKFYPQTPPQLQPALSGTLLALLSTLLHHRRAGQLPRPEFNQLSSQLINTCQRSTHRMWLRLYRTLDIACPRHPKGLRWVVKNGMGV